MKRRTLIAGLTSMAGLAAWAQQAWAGVSSTQTALGADAALFFQRGQMLSAKFSPGGKRLAMRTVAVHGKVMLSVIELASMTPTVLYSHKDVDVDEFEWVNEDRLVFTMADYDVPVGQLDAGPGMFAVDHDGANFKQLVERQYVVVRNGNDSQRLEPWNTFLLSSTVQRNDHNVMVWRPEQYDEDGLGYIGLLKLNTRTARAEPVEGPLHAVAWIPDPSGEVRACVTSSQGRGAVRWKDPTSAQWRVLSEFDVFTEESELDIRHIDANGLLFVTARRGGDKQALWTLNPLTGAWSEQALALSPQFDVDAQVIARKSGVVGYRFTIDAEVTQWVDKDLAALQRSFDKALPNRVNRLSVPWQGDEPWVLIRTHSDVQPAQFLLFNRETKKLDRLGAARPDLDAKKQAPSELINVKARDGMIVPTWLTVPTGAAKPLPMVVLVHGGPWVSMPEWRWDAEVQFLVAQGYAVLRPQFRGTMGLGQAHFRASWRQWGKAMQDDVTDATRWAIAQGIADPKRIAIAGASYGGYSALMGLVREPELYRCAVAWVGVTDLGFLYTVAWSDFPRVYKKKGLPFLVGDKTADAADLKAFSPLTHAATIRQPILLAYGEKDKRVPLIHGEEFRKAVQTKNRAVEWVEYKDEGHGWRDPANTVDFYNRMARFLDSNLRVQ
ncbi:MAG: alpha/beta fold hydrolase [Comamonadaceae bacterium]